MCLQLYGVVSIYFPALPKHQLQLEEPTTGGGAGDMVNATSVVYPHILPKLYPCISMLYVLNWKKEDEEYWARILKWNRHTDVALLAFLEIDRKFWLHQGGGRGPKHDEDLRDVNFKEAVETLQQIKTKFTPLDKIGVVVDTVKYINKSIEDHFWSMDELFPGENLSRRYRQQIFKNEILPVLRKLLNYVLSFQYFCTSW